MSARLPRFAFRIAAIIFTTAVVLLAQTDRATVTGTITDSNGRSIPQAVVTIESKSTGLRRTASSAESGAYTVGALQVGFYSASVTATGFQGKRIGEFELQVGQTRTFDFSLSVAAVETSIDVVAEAPIAQTNAAVTGVIGGGQIQNLPVNGRSWASLMSLIPGAVDTGGNDQRSVRFAGRGLDDNNFRFDGVDAGGIQNSAQRVATRLQVSTEAIAEFRASSALYSAETGGTNGGQVEIVSKTGSNDIRGSVFEFLRNSYFDARSFDTRTPSPAPFRLNQFGGSLGGPILKNRTFFFVSYEGLRQSLGQSLTGVVPSDAFRAQVLAKSPVLKPILDAYPTGIAPTSDPNVATWYGSGKQSLNGDSGMFRVDHRISDKFSLFVRYSEDYEPGDVPLGGNGFLRDHVTTKIKPYNAIVSFQQIWSPNLINETKAGFNRSDFITANQTLLPYAVTVPSFSTLNNYLSKIARSNSFSGVDNLTYSFGRHTFKAGVEIKRVQINQSATATDDLTIAYASATDFLNNVVSSVVLNAAIPVLGVRKTNYYYFAQDEFKLLPNLTLNVGLRYEYFGVMHEVLNRGIPFDPHSCGPTGFCAPGSAFYFSDPKDVSPRVAIAWSPKSMQGKLVIRSGYGIYYGESQLGDQQAPINNVATRLSLTSSSAPGLKYPVDTYLATASNSLTPRGLDRNRVNQNIQQWGLSVQREVARDTVVEAGYLGTKGTHLFEKTFVNAIDPATGKRPIPAVGLVDYKTSYANSEFNALQLSARRNVRNGLLLSANYMWSHSINDGTVGGGEGTNPENINCRACERASSDQDIRSVLTASAVWSLPFGKGQRFGASMHGLAGTLLGGWQFSSIASARTGRPVNIVVTRKTTDLPDQNNGSQRPNAVPGVSVYSSNQTPGGWLNPAAFAVPAVGVWGNLGRNIARGPGLWQIDPALTKRTQLREFTSLEFRAEAFNILNRAQYGDPVNSISNAAQFGKITAPINTGATGSGTPRQFQFMLRLAF
jgi:hypothetical protein